MSGATGNDRGGHPALHSGPESPARSVGSEQKTRETEGSRPPKSGSGAWKEGSCKAPAGQPLLLLLLEKASHDGKERAQQGRGLSQGLPACALERPQSS